MSEEALPWLPPAQPGDVDRAAKVLVKRWAADWFVAPGQVRIKPHPGRSDEDLRWFGAPSAAAALTPAMQASLGFALAGRQAEIDHASDRAILEKLALTAVADLGHVLAQAAGQELLRPGERPPTDNLVLRASGEGENWTILVSLDAQAQVSLRRIAAGRGRQPKLTSLADALTPEPVRLGCHLGSATLSTGELAGLGVGDLIALDRRLTDSLKLTVAADTGTTGQAVVIRDEGGVVVRIAQGIDF